MKKKFLLGGLAVCVLGVTAGIIQKVISNKKKKHIVTKEEIDRAIEEAILRGDDVYDVMYSEIAIDWNGDDRDYAESLYHQLLKK